MDNADSNPSEGHSDTDAWHLAPLPLEALYAIYAQADHWPLQDAIRLLLGLRSRVAATGNLDAKAERKSAVMFELAYNCVGHSLRIASPTPPDGQVRVRPLDILNWVEDIEGITPPATLAKGVREQAEKKGLSDAKGKPKARRLLPSQRHAQRCAGIAALIWRNQPTLTIEQVAKRAEIRELGCQGKDYKTGTVKDWIRAEKPDGGKPGRPPKSS